METGYILEIIETSQNLNKYEQALYKNKLKQLNEKSGIVSLCLDEKSLFVEYSEKIISKPSIIDMLTEIEFPMILQSIKS